jgi:putative sigma-54 modulation protein
MTIKAVGRSRLPTLEGGPAMLWNLKSDRGHIDPDLTAHIERRLRFALSRFSGRIRRVNVFLADQNGPRGGIDKTCRIVVILRDGGNVVAEVNDVDWVIAVDRATTRIGHSTGRDLARRRAGRRTTRGAVPFLAGSDGAAAW